MASPKEQVEALLNDVLPFAKKMLRDHGEFFPYGGYLRSDGAIVHAGATDPKTDRPRSATLIEALTRDFGDRARRGEVRATAIVLDVRVMPPGESVKTDAIQVNLEHEDSYCAEIFFPYHRNSSSVVDFGETFAQEGEHIVFPK